jgi:hypothetical protein
MHTSWSFDAYIFGNTMTGPADAYKYAKGETIKHPLGYPIKITTPPDWMGVFITGRPHDNFGIGWARTQFSDGFVPFLRQRL